MLNNKSGMIPINHERGSPTMMKPAFFSFIFATLLLTGCASSSNNYANTSSNNSGNLMPAQPASVSGPLNPATSTVLSNNQFNMNSNNNNFNNTLPKSNNSPMNLVQNQQSYPKSVGTEIISGSGFSGMSQSVSVNGFTAQMSQGSSRSSHGG